LSTDTFAKGMAFGVQPGIAIRPMLCGLESLLETIAIRTGKQQEDSAINCHEFYIEQNWMASVSWYTSRIMAPCIIFLATAATLPKFTVLVLLQLFCMLHPPLFWTVSW
jgi:hypothetical protein